MKAKMSHIQTGFLNWYTKDLAPQLGWKAVLATPIVIIAIENIIKKQDTFISLLTDENGDIDIEKLHSEYHTLISKSGCIEFFGIKFNVQDLDMLYENIKAEIPR